MLKFVKRNENLSFTEGDCNKKKRLYFRIDKQLLKIYIPSIHYSGLRLFICLLIDIKPLVIFYIKLKVY